MRFLNPDLYIFIKFFIVYNSRVVDATALDLKYSPLCIWQRTHSLIITIIRHTIYKTISYSEPTLIYHDGCNNAVQVCSFIKPWTVCSNIHEQAFQQHCSSWPAQPCSSLSITTFKLASSTMFKPVNNHVKAGQLNHVEACQKPCSSWIAQPCSSLSTSKNKLCIFMCVVQKIDVHSKSKGWVD